jgi:hypothetical protein
MSAFHADRLIVPGARLPLYRWVETSVSGAQEEFCVLQEQFSMLVMSAVV